VKSPFETLGIEPTFDIDLEAVEQRYRELSRVVHPDKFAKTGAQERRRSLGLAVDVNAAWRVVKDPIRRAEALLALRGVTVDERSQKASPALLMDVMELREELSDAKAARNVAKIRTLAASMETRERTVIASLSSALGASHNEKSMELLGELKYVRRFLDEVKAIEEEMADSAAQTT
jgi:molecular chaperone HscB